jgi:hypothetical protein
VRHARLTIDIHYNDPATDQEIRDRLDALVDRAAGEGMFTGDGPLTVEGWSHDIAFFGTEPKFAVGDEVFWHDPDDELCSGHYIVQAVVGDIYRLRNDAGSETEAFEHELE